MLWPSTTCADMRMRNMRNKMQAMTSGRRRKRSQRSEFITVKLSFGSLLAWGLYRRTQNYYRLARNLKNRVAKDQLHLRIKEELNVERCVLASYGEISVKLLG